MEINGKIHCLFEQSGTFKNVFKELGYSAFDYDIQNEFGETDFVCDLFSEIISAHVGDPSYFDNMSENDLIFAFFPCTYFSDNNVMLFTGVSHAFRSCNQSEMLNYLIDRSFGRERFYRMLLMLCEIVESRGLRLIIENPYSSQGYLYNNFPYKPAIIDRNRRLRGDYFIKPTQYFFVNCQPSRLESVSKCTEKRDVQHSSPSRKHGLCSQERSMISPVYAKNFICDFVLGEIQDNTIPTLFND